MRDSLPTPVWIDTLPGFNDLISILQKQKIISVDTESNSLHAYREQVCLIQVSTHDMDYLIDPLALPNLDPFGKILANPDIEKIFHAAEYDLICLKRDFGFKVVNLFDTRWAVRVLGYPGDGLEGLLKAKFDIRVNKKFQKANWAIRPLDEEQTNYARLDTRYLIRLREILKAELEAKGLWQLAHEDIQRSCDVELPNGKPELWERMGNHHSHSLRELTILKEISLVREQIAEKLDRPVFKVMSEKHLITMAQFPPKHMDELYGLGLSHRQVERWGKALLQAVARGQDAPLVVRPQAEHPDEAFLSRLDTLKKWRKETARKMRVESDVVLPKPLMEKLAEDNPRDMDTLREVLNQSAWRVEKYGAQLLHILQKG